MRKKNTKSTQRLERHEESERGQIALVTVVIGRAKRHGADDKRGNNTAPYRGKKKRFSHLRTPLRGQELVVGGSSAFVNDIRQGPSSSASAKKIAPRRRRAKTSFDWTIGKRKKSHRIWKILTGETISPSTYQNNILDLSIFRVTYLDQSNPLSLCLPGWDGPRHCRERKSQKVRGLQLTYPGKGMHHVTE
jgi:hypothetical protein